MTIAVKSIALAGGLAVATLTGAAGIANASPASNAPAKAPATKTAEVTPVQYNDCYREPVYDYRWTPYGWREVFVGYRTRCYDSGPRFRFHFGF